MKIVRSERGFQFLVHGAYVPPHEEKRLVSQSSVVGEYEDSFERPGSSALWIGDEHHLNREEVAQLVQHLSAWLKSGSLEVVEEEAAEPSEPSPERKKLPPVNVIFAIEDGEIVPQTVCGIDPMETDHAMDCEEEFDPNLTRWAEPYIPASRVRKLRSDLIAAYHCHPDVDFDVVIDTSFDKLLAEAKG